MNYYKRVIIVKEKAPNLKIKGSVRLIKDGDITLDGDFILNGTLNGYLWCLSGDSESVVGTFDNVCKFTYKLDDNFTFYKGASFSIMDKINKKILCYGESGTPYVDEKSSSKFLEEKYFKGAKKIVDNSSKIEYDDYLIATENYYSKEDEKLLYQQTNRTQNFNKQEEPKKEVTIEPVSNETGFSDCEDFNYYKKVEEKLNDLIKTHEKSKKLSELLGGEIVKINYDELKEYFVGKILKEGKPKYILYGIRGSYSTIPKNFENAHFIPESEFNLEGMGYYFIFQSVHTGEVII